MLKCNKILQSKLVLKLKLLSTHMEYLTFFGKKFLSLASSLLSMEKLRSRKPILVGIFPESHIQQEQLFWRLISIMSIKSLFLTSFLILGIMLQLLSPNSRLVKSSWASQIVYYLSSIKKNN